MSDSDTADPFESFKLAEDRRYTFHKMETCHRCEGQLPVFKDTERSSDNMRYTIINPCRTCLVADTRNYYIPKLLDSYSKSEGGVVADILHRVIDRLGDEAGECLVKDAVALHKNGFTYVPEVFDANNN